MNKIEYRKVPPAPDFTVFSEDGNTSTIVKPSGFLGHTVTRSLDDNSISKLLFDSNYTNWMQAKTAQGKEAAEKDMLASIQKDLNRDFVIKVNGQGLKTKLIYKGTADERVVFDVNDLNQQLKDTGISDKERICILQSVSQGFFALAFTDLSTKSDASVCELMNASQAQKKDDQGLPITTPKKIHINIERQSGKKDFKIEVVGKLQGWLSTSVITDDGWAKKIGDFEAVTKIDFNKREVSVTYKKIKWHDPNQLDDAGFGEIREIQDLTGPLSIDGLEFDGTDLSNPAFLRVAEKVKMLYEQIINSEDSKYFLEEFGDEPVHVSVEINQKEGVALRVKQPFHSDRKEQIFLAGEMEDEGIADAVKEIKAEAEELGIGKEASKDSAYKQTAEKAWKFLMDLNGQLSDFLSIARNTTDAIVKNSAPVSPDGSITVPQGTPGLMEIVIMAKVGGVMAIVSGSWLTLKALRDIAVAIVNGDIQGLGVALLDLAFAVTYVCIGILMVGVVIAGELAIGLVFYVSWGLRALYMLGKNILFSRELRQKIQTEDLEQLVDSFEWLRDQAGGNEAKTADFARRTSADCARRIRAEVNDDFLIRLRNGDPEALEQAKFLVGLVEKANILNAIYQVLFLIISVLGIAGMLATGPVAPALLFVFGAIFWLIACDLQIWPKVVNGEIKFYGVRQQLENKIWNSYSKSSLKINIKAEAALEEEEESAS